MSRYITDTGIVLSNLNYKDSHKIYTIFTRDHGKLSVIGRGVRKIPSRRAGNLDTLNLIKVHLYRNTKGFYNLREVVALNVFKNIKDDLDLSRKATYLISLIDTFVEYEHVFPKMVQLLEFSLDNLNKLPDVLSEYGYIYPESANSKKLSVLNKISSVFVAHFELLFLHLMGFGVRLNKPPSDSNKVSLDLLNELKYLSKLTSMDNSSQKMYLRHLVYDLPDSHISTIQSYLRSKLKYFANIQTISIKFFP